MRRFRVSRAWFCGVSLVSVPLAVSGCGSEGSGENPDGGGQGATGAISGANATAGSSGSGAGVSGKGGASGSVGNAGSSSSGTGGAQGGTNGVAGTSARGESGGLGGAGSAGEAPVAGTGGGSGAGEAGGGGAGGSGGGAGEGGSAGGAAAGMAGAAGTAGSAGSAGSGGAASDCPLELVGFATLEGGTTGGGDASPTTVTTQAELKACATAVEPRVCRVQGTLTFSPFEEIRVSSDKTIIGAGANAAIVMGGFFLASGVHNVIIRNLTVRDSYVEGQDAEGGDEGGDRDGVQMDTAHHVWIDHCRFSHLGDGLIDSRKDTTFETVSWNVLENHNKAFGIGWTENVTAELTIHHNWIRNTTQRNPSTDNVLRAHLFNNLLEDVGSYGNYARGGTNMVLQNSVFIDVNDPHYYDTGTLVATDNLYRGTSGQQESSGTSFSFFDPAALYAYSLDPASEVEALVKRCAGPRAELGN